MLIFTCIHETAFMMITIEPSCIICSDDRPHYAVISLEISSSIETPKTINFPFVPNGKLMFLGVLIFLARLSIAALNML